MTYQERAHIYRTYIAPMEASCGNRYKQLTNSEIASYLEREDIEPCSRAFRDIQTFFEALEIFHPVFGQSPGAPATQKSAPGEEKRSALSQPSAHTRPRQTTQTHWRRHTGKMLKKATQSPERKSYCQEERFLEEMKLANFSMKTRKSYQNALYHTDQWCRNHHQKGVHQMEPEMARTYFLYLLDTKRFTQSTYNVYRSAIRFYFSIRYAMPNECDERVVSVLPPLAEAMD